MIKRWLNNWLKIIKDFFTAIGFLWLIVEVFSFFFERNIQNIKDNLEIYFFIIFIILSLLYGVVKNKPKNLFTVKIRNKDSWISIKIGDAFKNTGALIIPFNDYLDVSLNGNVSKAKSIQNKLINDYFSGAGNELETIISGKTKDVNKPLEIGSVIEIEKKLKTFFSEKTKRFYLLVNTKKQKNNRVSSSIDDFMLAVNKLWEFLSNDTTKGELITIPLINTQHGRNGELTREVVIKQIIDTFIDTSKCYCICEELIISIHPNDIKKGELDFDELCNYLEFQAKNYKDIKFDPKLIGKEIEESTIQKIDS